MQKIKTVAILGAGKLGIVLAQLCIKAGYQVNVAGSKEPSEIALSVKLLAPGAKVMSGHDAANGADIVILALPLGKYRSINVDSLRGKLVIDAMNYWWEVDGPKFTRLSSSSSEMVQAYLKDARVVKALSHMGYHNLFDEARPEGAEGRKAIAIAGNSRADINQVSGFIDSIGFDPLYIGDLASGVHLEPGHPAFGANVGMTELKKLLTAN